MALLVPTATPWLQNSGLNNSAQLMRLAASGLAKGNVTGPSTIGPKSGCAPNSYNVTQNGGGNMSVNVSPGLALVNGTEAFAQGGYWVINDATVNLTVTASSSSANRTDSVYLAIQDDFYSGATHTAILAVAAGNPATPTTPPTLPANAFEVYRITVRQNTTSILTTDLSDRRPWISALGGISAPRSFETALNGTHDGDFRYDQTTGRLDRWDTATSAWQNLLEYGDNSHMYHSLGYGPVAANTPTQVGSFAQDRSAGLVTMTGSNSWQLLRPGKWSVCLRHYSATGVNGRMATYASWSGGPWRLGLMEDNSYRASGWTNSGELRKWLSWTGYVSAAQAANPITVGCRWSPQDGTTTTLVDNDIEFEYLGG